MMVPKSGCKEQFVGWEKIGYWVLRGDKIYVKLNIDQIYAKKTNVEINIYFPYTSCP